MVDGRSLAPRPPLHLLLIGVLSLFLAISAYGLEDRRLQGDESATISHARTVARTRTLGSDLWRGLDAADQRVYFQQPLYAVLFAPLLTLDPVGLRAGRCLSVLAGAMVVAGTLALGRQVGGAETGWLALFWLLLVRSCLVHQGTGIPLWDQSTVARSDIALSACAIWVGCLLLTARLPGRARRALGAGVVAAVGFYAHHLGLLLLLALLLALATMARRPLHPDAADLRLMGVFVAAWALTMLPYALYVGSGWRAFTEQMELHGARAPLLSAEYLFDTLRREPHRFATAASCLWPPRPALGPAAFFLGLPAALLTLVRASRHAGAPLPHPDTPPSPGPSAEPLSYRRARVADGGRFVTAMVVALAALLALLEPAKGPVYWITVLPFAAVALGDASRRWLRGRLRVPVMLLAALLAAEGAAALAHQTYRLATSRARAYEELMALSGSMSGVIPPETVIVGAFRHALALRARDYRTFQVVWFPTRHSSDPASVRLRRGLRQIGAHYLVVDRDLFAEAGRLGTAWVVGLRDLLRTSPPPVARFHTGDEPEILIYRVGRATTY